MKISTIVDKLRAYHPAIDEAHTCDIIKCGDPEQECTGITVTCFPSIEVIRKTIELGANFIIVHEPTFYNHDEATDFLEENSVYQAKKKLLDDNGIVIWRDHDHIHGGVPCKVPEKTDMIFYGIMKTLGWEDYLVSSPTKPLLFRVPTTTVEGLAQELMEKINLNGVRVIGDVSAKVETVLICEHLRGGEEDNEKIVEIETQNVDAAIPLEMIDWTVCEYIRDSCAMGRPRALLSLGHFNIEEPGMQYMAEHWLPELLEGQVPCYYVQSGDSFDYILPKKA